MREKFKNKFGSYPEDFKGVNAPYDFLGDYEADQLLQHFGFCSLCTGSGTAWAECCDGYRCSCGGAAQPFHCHNCNGTGKASEASNANTKFLESMAKVNSGRLSPNEWK